MNKKNITIGIIAIFLFFYIGITVYRKAINKYATLYEAIKLRDIELVKMKVKEVQGLNLFVNGDTYLTLCFWSRGGFYRRDYTPSEQRRDEFEQNTFDIVKILIENGADPNIKCQSREEGTPLIYAIYFGMNNIVGYLLNNHASVEIVDKNGWSPLMYAAALRPSCLDLLFQFNAKETINFKNKDGNTAMHILLYSRDAPEEVKYLIQNGADVTIKNNDGLTAVDEARKWKRANSLEILEKSGKIGTKTGDSHLF